MENKEPHEQLMNHPEVAARGIRREARFKRGVTKEGERERAWAPHGRPWRGRCGRRRRLAQGGPPRVVADLTVEIDGLIAFG